MIQVTIDIIPFGNAVKRKTVQTIDIFNDMTGQTDFDYRAVGKINKAGRFDKFPRAIGAVQLACKVMKEVLK